MSLSFSVTIGPLYSREGYLTHTLPTSPKSILISKILTGFVWIILSYLIAGGIVLTIVYVIAGDEIETVRQIWQSLIANTDVRLALIGLIIYLCLGRADDDRSSLLFNLIGQLRDLPQAGYCGADSAVSRHKLHP